jgi:MraZ protein
MYFGEYERTVDQKGRVTVPGHLLTASPDADWSRVTLVRADPPCLFLYDLRTWQAVLDAAHRSLDDDDGRVFMHRILADAHVAEIDSLNRVTVPGPLLAHASIGKRAIVVGMFNRLEIWDSAHWQQYLAGLDDVEVPSIADLSRARIREVS